MLPILSVNAKYEGLLLINGALAGDVGPNQWVNLPVTPNGRCYLHYLSARPEIAPCGCGLNFTDGHLQPVADDFPGEAVLWAAGIHEITLLPWTVTRLTPPPLVPETIDRLQLPQGEASLLKYGCLWVILEDDQGRLLLSAPLPEEAITGTLRPIEGGFTAAGQSEEGQWCAAFSAPENRWQRTLYACGTKVESGSDALITTTELPDTVSHQLISRWQPRGGRWEESKSIRVSGPAPEKPEEVASAFLQACVLREYTEARSYLTASLRAQLSIQGLLENFIGPIESCGVSRYSALPSRGEIALAAFTRTGSHFTEARTYYFTLKEEENALKIDDIRPE